jgi:hypothetical protein
VESFPTTFTSGRAKSQRRWGTTLFLMSITSLTIFEHLWVVPSVYGYLRSCNLILMRQDETGASAILAEQLDSSMGGKRREYREVQGSESPEFLQVLIPPLPVVSAGYSTQLEPSILCRSM